MSEFPTHLTLIYGSGSHSAPKSKSSTSIFRCGGSTAHNATCRRRELCETIPE